jgi:hypothetical protein
MHQPGRAVFTTVSLSGLNALAFENKAGTNNIAANKVRSFFIMAHSYFCY